MADTNHAHATSPVEGDGISYSGILWFVVVLALTTIVCEVFVWGLLKYVGPHRVVESQVAPLAPAAGEPSIDPARGALDTGLATPPEPALLVTEPTGLKVFRDNEEKLLHSYGWVNQGSQVVRLPIERAKDLLLERGLPTRQAAPAPPGAAQ